jgi:hypothetical protein
MKRLWDHLKEIAIEFGIDPKHMPQEWTYDAEKALYMWVGHAVVQPKIEARLRKERGLKRKAGRPKGASSRHPASSEEAQTKRDQRASFPFGPDREFRFPSLAELQSGKKGSSDRLSDDEWSKRFDRYHAKKSPKT